MICKTCHRKDAETGGDECFRCRVLSVGFTYKGGAIMGKSGWGTTKAEFLAEHIGDTRHLPEGVAPQDTHVRGC